MKLENLGELNIIYNFQYTIVLCEIFESRATYLQKMFKFNPRKCNSVSSFNGCVHRDKSKYLIALPTDVEQVKLFEKTLIGGFSCVNTRLAFDSQILIPKYGRDNSKLIYEIKTNKGKEKKKSDNKNIKNE